MNRLLLLPALLASLSTFGQEYRASGDPNPPRYGDCNMYPPHLGDLVLYYNFSNLSAGMLIPDLSGNMHMGTPTPGTFPDKDAGGNPNCAYRFPGNPGEHIQIPSSTDFDFATAPVTISVWYYPEETSPGKYEQLAGRGLGLHCPDSYGEYSLGLYDCRKPVAGMNQSSCWDWHAVTSPPNCTQETNHYLNDRWQHVVAVFDYASGGGPVVPVAVYWNSILVNHIPPGVCGPVSLNNGDFYIGDDFRGEIDEVRVYRVPFSAAEVANLYHYGIMGCCDVQGKPGGSASLPASMESTGDLKTYPNPFTGDIKMDVPQKFIGGSFSVYNALGQKVKTGPIRSVQEQLNLGSLPAGIYLLECSTGTERIQQKLVKR
ncbi:LamG-like jellyroll fold domain-containing protein [Taibaiella koreensis]|uniref:LamG-like jellyroll fold domain-containing protein n=1 Tax=Taibaiella koreensis TaxID=1268548 RepID=UPI0013C35855|nr:LamG-like jellyroll fold domain-containing protein [Taibaiella koreensis]